jgi:hypothetical protein
MGKFEDARENLLKKLDERIKKSMDEEFEKLFGSAGDFATKYATAQDYSDFNGGNVEDIYERLEYVRQFAGQRENPMQEAYPELWNFMKSVAEAFRGYPIDDKELSSIIAAGIRSWRDDRTMCQCIEFRCGICGKQCAYCFRLSEEEIACSAIDHLEMHKRHMFRTLGYKLSEHCEYALK